MAHGTIEFFGRSNATLTHVCILLLTIFVHHPLAPGALDQRLLDAIRPVIKKLSVVSQAALTAAKDSRLATNLVCVQNVREVLALANLVDAKVTMQVREDFLRDRLILLERLDL